MAVELAPNAVLDLDTPLPTGIGHPGDGSHTVSVWLSRTGPNPESWGGVVFYNGGLFFNSYWEIAVEDDGTILLVTGQDEIAASPPGAADDGHVFVAATVMPGEEPCTLYWRRLDDGSLSSASGVSTTGFISQVGRWGGDPPADGTWPGTLAYARAWTGTLTESELLAESFADSAVRLDDIWGDWPMHTAGTAGDDVSSQGHHCTAIVGDGTITSVPSPPLTPIEATLNGLLPLPVAEFQGIRVVPNEATLNGVLPLPVAEFQGEVFNTATLDGVLPLPVAEFDAQLLAPIEATLNGVLPLPVAGFQGSLSVPIEATLDGVLPLPVAEFRGAQTRPPKLPTGTRAPWQPTTTQILNLAGVRRRTDRFEFELLTRDDQPIGWLHPDTGRPPTVRNDVLSSGGRTLQSLHLPASERADINPISDRVRPWVVLQNGDRFSLGVFLWADASRPVRSWGEEFWSSLTDKTLMLNQSHLGAMSWHPGGASVALILMFLALNTLTFEEIGPLPPSADRGLTEPVSFSPGGTLLRAMTDVCEQVGMCPPWFDRTGLLHMQDPPEPGVDEPHMAPYGPGTRIIADSIVRSDDLLVAPNVFSVNESGTQSTIVGRYQIPASAPHSVQNRGFEVAHVESRQDLGSRSAANRAARALATTAGLVMDRVQFDSTLDPRHDGWDIVPYQPDDAIEPEPWVETAWQITCRSGAPMSHTLQKVHPDA